MINHSLILLALRTQALTLSIATTGVTTLAATATGYTRVAGSFIQDGFQVGQEVTPIAGFTQTDVGIIDDVQALTMTIRGGRTVDAGGAGCQLTVGLPALRALENIDLETQSNRWYVEEDYLPGPASQITLGPLGTIEADPMYVVKFYGVANVGPLALYAAADALLALFPPRQTFVLSTGDVVYVRTSPAPYRSQLLQAAPGVAAIAVTIPCRCRTSNAI